MSSCIACVCFNMSVLNPKVCSHLSHFNIASALRGASQSLQGYLGPSCLESMWHLKGFLICVSHGYWSHSWQGDPLSWVLLQCLPKCYIRLASWSQSSQGYLAPSYLDASCEDSLWFMRILGKGNQGSHWSQECLRAQCLDSLWTTSLTSQVVLYLHLS